MTKQEAIERLHNLQSIKEDDFSAYIGVWYKGIKDDYDEALKMAIEALSAQPELDNNSTKLDRENVDLIRREDVIKMIQETNISSGMTKARLLIKAQDLPSAHEPRLAQKIWMIVRKITDSDGLQHEVVYYNDLKDVMYEVMRWMI